MENNDNFLTIKIKFKGDEYEIKTENLINYDILMDTVIKQFNINEKKKKYLEFNYLDEDKDINILEKDTDIFSISQEDKNGNYFLKLDLNINEYENIENNNIGEKSLIEGQEENIIKEEKNNIIENNNKIIENDEIIINNKNIKNENVENIKREYQKKIKLINEIYENHIEKLKNDFNNIINERYKIIKQEILYLENKNIKNIINIENNKKNIIYNDNKQINNKYIRKNIKHSSDRLLYNKNKNNKIIEIDNGSDSDSNNSLNEISINPKIKDKKMNNIKKTLIKEEEDEDLLFLTELNKNNIEDKQIKENRILSDIVIYDKKEKNNLFKSSPLAKNNKLKGKDNFSHIKRKLKTTKKGLNSIHKKFKEYIDEIQKKGNEIKNDLNKNKYDKEDMNKFYVEYIDRKINAKKIPSKDKIEYYAILKKMNLFLENKHINQIIDEYLTYEGEFRGQNYESKIKEDKDSYRQKIFDYLNKKLF